MTSTTTQTISDEIQSISDEIQSISDEIEQQKIQLHNCHQNFMAVVTQALPRARMEFAKSVIVITATAAFTGGTGYKTYELLTTPPPHAKEEAKNVARHQCTLAAETEKVIITEESLKPCEKIVGDQKMESLQNNRYGLGGIFALLSALGGLGLASCYLRYAKPELSELRRYKDSANDFATEAKVLNQRLERLGQIRRQYSNG